MTRAATPADVIEGRARWCVVEGDALAVLAALPMPTPEEFAAARAAMVAGLWGLCAIVEAAAPDGIDDDEDNYCEAVADTLADCAHRVEDTARSFADAINEADEGDGEVHYIANLDVEGAREAVEAYTAAMLAAYELRDRAAALQGVTTTP